MKLILNQWFRVVLAVLLAIAVFIYYREHSISKAELYKITSECAQKSISFAKDKSNEFLQWEVLQSNFDKEEGNCFAEFHIGASGSSAVIYDLTHNKELALRPNLIFEANREYTEMAQKYEIVKNETFGIKK